MILYALACVLLAELALAGGFVLMNAWTTTTDLYAAQVTAAMLKAEFDACQSATTLRRGR